MSTLNTPGQFVTIECMPELDEMITTAEALKLVEALGKPITRQAITDAAREGNIEGARKLWDNEKAPWIFERKAFLSWLENKRSPGRPRKEEG